MDLHEGSEERWKKSIEMMRDRLGIGGGARLRRDIANAKVECA